MKRNLTLFLIGFVLLALATGCSRSNRNTQGDQPTDVPPAASPVATDTPLQPTLAPTAT